MKTYKNCSTLSIYSFCKIIQDSDLRFLIKDFDEEENNYEQFKSSIELQIIFNDIIQEYKSLIDEKKEQKRIKDEAEITLLNIEYSLLVDILSLYVKTEMIEVLDLFNSMGYSFDKIEPIGPQIDELTRKLKGKKNLINIKEANFRNKYLKKNDEEQEESDVDVLVGLDKMALVLETDLELGYKIKIKETSVLRWVNLNQMREAKIKAHEKNQAKWQKQK